MKKMIYLKRKDIYIYIYIHLLLCFRILFYSIYIENQIYLYLPVIALIIHP